MIRMLGRPQGQRQVVGEVGDLVDLDARGGFELVHRDDRAGLHLHHLPLDAEIGELLLEGPGIGDEVFPLDPRVLPLHAVEQGQGRQLEFPVHPADEIEMGLFRLLQFLLEGLPFRLRDDRSGGRRSVRSGGGFPLFSDLLPAALDARPSRVQNRRPISANLPAKVTSEKSNRIMSATIMIRKSTIRDPARLRWASRSLAVSMPSSPPVSRGLP